MKIKIELMPEEWGLVTAALKYAGVTKGEPWRKVNEKIMEQLEMRFKELEKREELEKHPEEECTACICDLCERVCLWFDYEADYCVNGTHSLNEDDVRKGCGSFENAW